MNTQKSTFTWGSALLTLALTAGLLIGLAGCNFSVKEDNSVSQDSLKETEIALSVQQTVVAQQNSGANATVAAQQATLQAQLAMATLQAAQAQQATQMAQAALATQMAMQAGNPTVGPVPPTQAPPAQPQPVQPQPPSQQQPPVPPANLDAQMKSANILLYEDMVGDPSEYRYVKRTLDAMGLTYKDDGNAIGWLKNDLIANAPNGKPWDLVIVAAELRSNVSGEYFTYLNDALRKGVPVILEAWHLDSISQGKVADILDSCGVQVYPYFPSSGINDVLLWQISKASGHPILNEPNSGLTFTKARDKWIWSMDLGSLMALTGRGDAALLIGRHPDDPTKDGAMTSCMNGLLTLQTFSSHSFPYETMHPLWENYIYNALRMHFSKPAG